MIEKVNPGHPDKVADRIAGAIVDLAYKKEENPKIAVEVLIGHNECNVIIETNVDIKKMDIINILERITGNNKIKLNLKVVPQDEKLAKNQSERIKCGDNGIFKGVPLNNLEKQISKLARKLYDNVPYDGKYILTEDQLIICQSNATNEKIQNIINEVMDTTNLKIIINPLGEWEGGTNVDTGATNRKLGSDMAQSVTGGEDPLFQFALDDPDFEYPLDVFSSNNILRLAGYQLEEGNHTIYVRMKTSLPCATKEIATNQININKTPTVTFKIYKKNRISCFFIN
ncbi:MAG: hypothetical protein BHW07_01765 [Clostridium sp. CAG_433_25_7]|nr:MAG: hypothetical protein BHW07_01765 [Clostridium sp. CAG_433_25_7]